MERRQNFAPLSSKGMPVLDVKPLRCLAPMFPAPLGFTSSSSSANAAPFVCITPFGSSGLQSGQPSGFPPAFPSFANVERAHNNGAADPDANDSMSDLSMSPFRTPPAMVTPLNENAAMCDGTTSGGRRRNLGSSDAEGSKKKKKQKRVKHKAQDVFTIPSSDDPREPVEVILMTYDALRRRLLQIEEAKNLNKSAHLQAGTIMMDNDLRVNVGKIIGSVPGLNIGDIFYFRFEMCLVGLHSQSMSGIDYLNTKIDNENDTLAISVVSSGGYDNETNDVEMLIYTGQGGSKVNDSKTQINDQKLERGNLALERSLHRSNQVRVIRGTRDLNTQTGKIYFYDGLYKINESWIEKGKSGFNVFKYKLLREPGQPDGFATWKMTDKWRENPSTRAGVILADMSSGQENLPICLVNEVDAEKPEGFRYSTRVRYLKPISSMKLSQGCACQSGCLPSNSSCHCGQQNGGDLPYGSNGLLVRRKPLIYECSSLCQCAATCQNRATQRGIRLHFEVFKTADRGWGLRSWDPIRAGTFVCEYTGELIDNGEYDAEEDDYIFETNTSDKTFKWNFGPELLGEPSPEESWDSFEASPITITAKNLGNISRFMNHSCSPNVFWQAVQHEHGDEGYPHIMFFAMKHIPPMTELTYDYGQSGRKTKRCLCGSVKCRGFFG